LTWGIGWLLTWGISWGLLTFCQGTSWWYFQLLLMILRDDPDGLMAELKGVRSGGVDGSMFEDGATEEKSGCECVTSCNTHVILLTNLGQFRTCHIPCHTPGTSSTSELISP